MYDRVLLAYDGTLEGRLALREGALLAKLCKAQLFLLAVIPSTTGFAVDAGELSPQYESYHAIFREGVARATLRGLAPVIAEMAHGDPAQEISAFAHRVSADLVVVGHRRKTLLERWWSGSNQSYLVDTLGCSLLVGRKVISDEVFEAS